MERERSSSTEVVVREAIPSDFVSIQAISRNIYNEHDYLSSKLEIWFKSSQHFLFVMEMDRKIVGFESFAIVDDESTAILQALRIKEEYRGFGLSTVLEQFIEDFIVEKFPQIDRIRITTSSIFAASIKLHSNQKFEKNNENSILLLEIGSKQGEDLYELINKKAKNDCKDVSVEETSTSELIHKNHLYVEDFILDDWVPLLFLNKNIKLMEKNGTVFLIQTTPDHQSQKSWSHGILTTRNNGFHWCCSIYTNVKEEFIVHLLHHLDLAKKRACTFLDIFYSTQLEDYVRSELFPKMASSNPWNCPPETRIRVLGMEKKLKKE